MVVSKLLAVVRRMTADQNGVTAVEYGVLGALIIAVCVGIIGTVGTNLLAYFQSIATATSI